MTYEEISAYCFALYCEPRSESYANLEELPEVVREAWSFPIALSPAGLIHLVKSKGRLVPTLTLEGERAALFHGTREGLAEDKATAYDPKVFNIW